MPPRETSWPGWSYPTWRESSGMTSETWLVQKKADDGAEGLWRIHNNLYDLTDWVNRHPGGSDWISMTKGNDITEAFESHHLGPNAESMLPKFYVRPAKTPRNSPYTFNPDGFYRILKSRVYEKLKTVERGPQTLSIRYIDTLALTTIILSVFAALKNNYILGLLAGAFLTFTVNCSHNFFHQRNNWRMYYFNLCMMSYREWRISHVLSHHLYTNTVHDLEMSLFEPAFQWLPRPEKSWVARYLPLIYAPLIYAIVYHSSYIKRAINKELEVVDFVVPFVIPACMLVCGAPLLTTVVMWTWILMSSSVVFGFIGFNAGHHHPDLFHDGDAPRVDRDWGLNQIDAVRDRIEVRDNIYLVLISYGDHMLHHLLPSLDHCLLNQLYPILEKTCKEFGLNFTIYKTAWSLMVGQYRQLIRNTPNKVPKK